ncbi:hypothetical protein VNO77_39354 [Canavalia gladiata]|uniref:Uncharacterized protein n=1 Tax=Canavalia gladiata TaxID=3824 RepID=A0AAN9KAY3_CANGL
MLYPSLVLPVKQKRVKLIIAVEQFPELPMRPCSAENEYGRRSHMVARKINDRRREKFLDIVIRGLILHLELDLSNDLGPLNNDADVINFVEDVKGHNIVDVYVKHLIDTRVGVEQKPVLGDEFENEEGDLEELESSFARDEDEEEKKYPSSSSHLRMMA